MFVGQYEVRLDAKHRVSVPLTLRESRKPDAPLWSVFYLTAGAEGCISVYTPEGWEQFMEGIGANKAIADSDLRVLQRLVAAQAVLRECDTQGRIIIADHLRIHAGLTRDVTWVGAASRAEIWDAGRWAEYQKKHISQLGEKMDLVSRFGLALTQRPDATSKGSGA